MSTSYKKNMNKEEYHQLPWKAIKELAKNSTYRSKKYAPGSWRECDDIDVWLNAAMRHYQAHMAGQLYDEDEEEQAKIFNLTCAAHNILFAIEMLLKPTEKEEGSKALSESKQAGNRKYVSCSYQVLGGRQPACELNPFFNCLGGADFCCSEK